MCESKFKKGPWSVEYSDLSSLIYVVSDSPLFKGDMEVCSLQHEPDAHLIAAAPEMYEMLDDLVSMSSEDAKLYIENSADILNLLAEARGE